MDTPNKKAGRFRDVIVIVALVLAVFVAQRLYAEILHLYDIVLEQGQMIDVLLQAENDRLARELTQRQTTEASPVEVAGISYTQPPVFEPLDVPLDTELQEHAWRLCQQNDIPFEVVMAIAWHESRFTVDAVGCNDNGTCDSGLMQINDINRDWLAEHHGLDIEDPYDNIEAGIIILSRFWHRYTPEQALTAYAWGEAGMLEAGVTAPAAERILERADLYEAEHLLCQ